VGGSGAFRGRVCGREVKIGVKMLNIIQLQQIISTLLPFYIDPSTTLIYTAIPDYHEYLMFPKTGREVPENVRKELWEYSG
jgi:hypothetical protein